MHCYITQVRYTHWTSHSNYHTQTCQHCMLLIMPLFSHKPFEATQFKVCWLTRQQMTFWLCQDATYTWTVPWKTKSTSMIHQQEWAISFIGMYVFTSLLFLGIAILRNSIGKSTVLSYSFPGSLKLSSNPRVWCSIWECVLICKRDHDWSLKQSSQGLDGNATDAQTFSIIRSNL